jgi:hypothetical protein
MQPIIQQQQQVLWLAWDAGSKKKRQITKNVAVARFEFWEF